MNNFDKLIKLLKNNDNANKNDVANLEKYLNENKELDQIKNMLLETQKTKIPYKR